MPERKHYSYDDELTAADQDPAAVVIAREEQAEQEELLDRIPDLMAAANLKPQERIALVMHCGRLDYRFIGWALEVSPSTARRYVNTARKKCEATARKAIAK